jgi:acyl-CoA-binding protein
MSDLDSRFQQAVARLESLPEKPDTARCCRCMRSTSRPSGDAAGDALASPTWSERQWDAWDSSKALSREEAMTRTSTSIESLK